MTKENIFKAFFLLILYHVLNFMMFCLIMTLRYFECDFKLKILQWNRSTTCMQASTFAD